MMSSLRPWHYAKEKGAILERPIAKRISGAAPRRRRYRLTDAAVRSYESASAGLDVELTVSGHAATTPLHC